MEKFYDKNLKNIKTKIKMNEKFSKLSKQSNNMVNKIHYSYMNNNNIKIVKSDEFSNNKIQNSMLKIYEENVFSDESIIYNIKKSKLDVVDLNDFLNIPQTQPLKESYKKFKYTSADVLYNEIMCNYQNFTEDSKNYISYLNSIKASFWNNQNPSNLKIEHHFIDHKCSSKEYVHSLTWKGDELIYKKDLKCKICDLNSQKNALIRWYCENCYFYYCTNCKPILHIKTCPIKHKLEYLQDYVCDFVCDKCNTEDRGKVNIYADKKCNLSFCVNCYREAWDEYEKED